LEKITKGSFRSKVTFIITLLLIIIMGAQLIYKGDLQITNKYEIDKLQYRFSTLEDFGGGLSSRTIMWDYTWEIIRNYSTVNYIVGDGFNYNAQYGEKFNNKSGFTYPHNIAISTFHYSGIIGLTLLIIILIAPIFILIKTKKEIELLIVYLMCIAFLTISGNSFFSINIMWLLAFIILNGTTRESEL